MKILLILAILAGLLLTSFIIWAIFPSLPQSVYKKGQFLYIPSPSQNIAAWTPETPITFMTYNIGFAGGATGLDGRKYTKKDVEKNLAGIIQAIKTANPDVLTTQEIDIDSNRSYNIDQVKLIAKQCNFPYVAIAYTWDARWVPNPFFTLPKYQFGKTIAGQVVFSKYPIRNQTILRFKKPKTNTFIYNLFYLDRVLQTTQIQLSADQILTVSNIHLEAFDQKTRELQAKQTLDFLTKKYPTKTPQILTGDFNATDSFLNTEDPKELTLNTLRQSQLFREVLDKLPPAQHKNYLTYPATAPKERLDYTFYTQHLVPLNVSIPQTTASDHKPLVTSFKIPENRVQ